MHLHRNTTLTTSRVNITHNIRTKLKNNTPNNKTYTYKILRIKNNLSRTTFPKCAKYPSFPPTNLKVQRQKRRYPNDHCDHEHRNDGDVILRLCHVHFAEELLRIHEMAIVLVARQLLPAVTQYRQDQSLETILQKRYLEDPTHVRVRIVELDEETREDSEWKHQERSENDAVLKTIIF